MLLRLRKILKDERVGVLSIISSVVNLQRWERQIKLGILLLSFIKLFKSVNPSPLHFVVTLTAQVMLPFLPAIIQPFPSPPPTTYPSP